MESTGQHSPLDRSADNTGGLILSEKTVELTQTEHIELKAQANYWKALHGQQKRKTESLEKELAQAQATIKDLNQRLYGKKTEKGTCKQDQAGTDNNAGQTVPTQPRGQQKGRTGHGRKALPDLPVYEEVLDISPEDQLCRCCQKPYQRLPQTEDSKITEVHVKAHVRLIKRKMYAQACQCSEVKGIITAPPAPRLIPKSSMGLSIWTEVLINKYLFSRATYNLCIDYSYRGLPMAPGTLTGGLEKIAPLFKPLIDELIKKQLTEDLFHADETGWKVYVHLDGKVGYRWYLWVFQSKSVVHYILAPSRSGDIPIDYFFDLDKKLDQVIVVCDRYSGYKRLARENEIILLAFCWAHVRRDFLDAAKSWPELKAWMFSWVDRIATLYFLNKQRLPHWQETLSLEEQSPDFIEHQQKFEQALERMREQSHQTLSQNTLHTAQRKVLKSLQTHWQGLTIMVKHPQVPMDNNTAEQRMRNPAMGRKNYYGSCSEWSAELAAMMFSVFQTLILWQLNPHHWLYRYLSACAENAGQPPDDIIPFIPWQMSESQKQALAKPIPLSDIEGAYHQQDPPANTPSP